MLAAHPDVDLVMGLNDSMTSAPTTSSRTSLPIRMSTLLRQLTDRRKDWP